MTFRQVATHLVVMAVFTYLNARLHSDAVAKCTELSSLEYGDEKPIPFENKQQRTVMGEWLHRLHSLLVPGLDATTFQSRGPNKVQLVRQPFDIAWSFKTSATLTSWANYTPSKVTIDTPSGGALVAFFGAHLRGVQPFSSIQARFLFNDTTAFENSWGAFYVDEGSIGIWRPICFAQMYALPTAADRQTIEVQLQTKSSTVTINGGGLMAAAFPPPAFLSSIRALSATGSSNQSPYSNLVHTIEVHSNKAILIMAANGRITGRGLENTSLTYTVNGVSPAYGRGKSFGHYFVSHSSTESNFIPMGLYQLAEVSRGTHTVQLEGSGSPFDLNYVTSQITTIPISDVQLRTVTADWEVETPKRSKKSLIAAEFVTRSGSVLIITATFSAYSTCIRQGTYQFDVDGKRLYETVHHTENHQLGVWGEASGSSLSSRVPTPGSSIAFVEVEKGQHLVELVNFNEGVCSFLTQGAVLQVGVVLNEYWLWWL